MAQGTSPTSFPGGVPETLVVIVVLEGLFLLNHKNMRGGAVALVFALALLVLSRFLTAKGLQLADRPLSYESWLISKISEASTIYGGKIGSLPSSSYLALVESNMYPQLRLELSEFMLLQVLAVGGGIDIMWLLESSFSRDAPTMLKVNGKIYKPRNALARMLLGMAGDSDFSDIPIRRWIIQGKQFLFELDKSETQLDLPIQPAKVESDSN